LGNHFTKRQLYGMIDDDSSDSEDRWQTMGFVGNVLFVVYTERGDVTRIISARVAEPFERRIIMAMLRYTAAKRPYTYDPDCPLTSLEPRKLSDYSPEKIERLKAAQKRHAAFDPGCEKLTLEEFINWHPVGGISWEERARRMEAAGKTDPEKEPVTAVSDTP
jgi:hypothetical protein